MANIICGCYECKYWLDGECTADTIEIDETLTAAGFLQLCDTYDEGE